MSWNSGMPQVNAFEISLFCGSANIHQNKHRPYTSRNPANATFLQHSSTEMEQIYTIKYTLPGHVSSSKWKISSPKPET